MIQRGVELLHGAERLAEFLAKLGRRLVQRFQDVFFVFRRHLFLGERIAGLAIDGIEADHILAAQVRNRA